MISNSRQYLDLVISRTCGIGAVGAAGTLIVMLLRACGSLDGGDELTVVENGSVNAAMTAFTEKTLGGEAVGGRFKISIGEVGNLKGFPFVVPVVGIACCYRRLCIAGEVAHMRGEAENVECVRV